jgi:hypothetical protein
VNEEEADFMVFIREKRREQNIIELKIEANSSV